MRFSKSTVRHSSTKIFRRAEIFARNLFAEHNSEPEAERLSSVEDVTATRMMQARGEISFEQKAISRRSRPVPAAGQLCIEAQPLPSRHPVIYTQRLP
jgi:hypothetical protein